MLEEFTVSLAAYGCDESADYKATIDLAAISSAAPCGADMTSVYLYGQGIPITVRASYDYLTRRWREAVTAKNGRR